MKFNVHIFNDLKNARGRKNLSQVDVALASELSIMTVKRIEAGNMDVKFSNILKYATVVGIDIASLTVVDLKMLNLIEYAKDSR